jgi:catechol 2,3-dioxygenase-like lactoylglutathione lyase family enzyme
VPRFHHVNLGVPVDGLDAEATFLVDILGYREASVPEALRDRAHWFDADDGSQVHLSEDPDHHPAARAHVAVNYGADLDGIERRLVDRGVSFDAMDTPAGVLTASEGLRVLFCQDPAGNRWELRGAREGAS